MSKAFSSALSRMDITARINANDHLRSATWMRTALKYFGTMEVPGSDSNPLIVQFIASAISGTYRAETTPGIFLEISEQTEMPLVCSVGFDFRQINRRGRVGRRLDEEVTHWCSAFANHVMISSGYRGTRSLAARSWHRWGKKIEEREIDQYFGAIAVFSRPSKNNPNAGHVGFYVGESGNNYLILGGNQSDSVCVKPYRKSRLLSFRWPD